MTVASEVSRSGPYVGNGVTTIFNYGFRILNENHLRIILAEDGVETVLVIDTDYIVSDVGEAGGGQVALVNAPTASQTVTILRDVPFTQETDLENQGAYYAETVEAAFDQAAMRDQQINERLDRALTIPASADPSALADLIGDVIRLSDSADAIDELSAIADSVDVVAGIAADVTTVAGIAGDVSAVAENFENIEAVAAIDASVSTVAGIASDVVTVAAHAGDISALAMGPVGVCGRLSLTSGIAVTIADVTNATALYLVPEGGNKSEIWDGLRWNPYEFSQITLSLSISHAANSNYDVFEFDDAGALNIGTGPAWASNIARGVGVNTSEIELWEGRLVNKNAVVLRNGGTTYNIPARRAKLRGGFRTIGIAGNTEDSAVKRLLSNIGNTADRRLARSDPATSWVYNGTGYRQANANAANQVQVFSALASNPIDLTCTATFLATGVLTDNNSFLVTIGVNSTTTNGADSFGLGNSAAGLNVTAGAKILGNAPLGFTEYNWLEIAPTGSGTHTWYGTTGLAKSGLLGKVNM